MLSMTPKSIVAAVAAVAAVYPYARAEGDGQKLNFYCGGSNSIPCAALNLSTGALTMVPPDTVYTTTYPAAAKLEEEEE